MSTKMELLGALVAVILIIVLMSASCFLLQRFNAKTYTYFLVLPVIGVLIGIGFAIINGAYAVDEYYLSVFVGGLAGVQYAWIATTR